LLNEFVELVDNKIYFGLTDIKGVGQSAFIKLVDIIKKDNIDIKNIQWIDMLFLLERINSTAAKALIQSGALDHLGLTRNKMLFEYTSFTELTAKELSNLKKISDPKQALIINLEKLIQSNTLNVKRVIIVQQIVKNIKFPPYSMTDNIEWLADTENMLLGCSITCSKIDMYDISMVTCSCKEFKNGYNLHSNIMIAGEIENIRTVKTKKGKDAGSEMAFITMSDGTAEVDSVVFFPEAYKQYRNQLFPGNIVILKGNKSKNKDGLVVEKVYLPKS
jgi:DNA polymerase-3 subunit alpha